MKRIFHRLKAAQSGLLPVLDFNFLTQTGTTLPSGLTLTRAASGATRYRFAQSGLMVAAGANVACNEWDSTGVALGLRLEPAMTNLVLNSHSLSGWADNGGGTGKTITGSTLDPLGGTTAQDFYNGTSGLSNGYKWDSAAIAPGANNYVSWVYADNVDRLTSSVGGVGLFSNPTILNNTAPYASRNYGGGWAVSVVSIGAFRVGNQGYACCWLNQTNQNPTQLTLDFRIGTTRTNRFYDCGIAVGSLPPNPITTTGSSASNDADDLAFTAGSFSSVNATKGTFVIEHDLPDVGTLIKSNGAAIITAPTTGTAKTKQYTSLYPRVTMCSYRAGSSTIRDSVAPGSPISGGALTISTNLKIGVDRCFHIRRVRWYSQDFEA
jgi:hypothetical protein